jgi:hypothetical protein
MRNHIERSQQNHETYNGDPSDHEESEEIRELASQYGLALLGFCALCQFQSADRP